jgi:hypothetical protein
VPVPQIYVLEREAGINAFAAGYSPANAAIAVTRGALVNLDRDELQGVIAHEFSHVLNGDMRLSTRLIGLLFGLTVIAMIARTILRIVPRGRSSGRKGGGALAVIVLAALVVLALGWIGLFFGRLIQAAVSRHRESLADASAVQFTRDPQGLRNALVKIGALGAGSRFSDADAEEVAHLLFAEGTRRVFATHPPLIERIREIDPRFQPSEFDEVRRRIGEARAAVDADAARESPATARRSPLAGAIAVAPAALPGLVGNPGTEHVLQAGAVLASLPDSFRRAAQQPAQAAVLFVALAIDTVPEARERQLAYIREQYGDPHHAAVKAMLPQVDALTAVQRMPALLQVFAALNQLGRGERVELLKCLNGLLVRENQASAFSYALRKLAQAQLQDNLDPRRRTAGHLRAQGARDALQVLFSALASQGVEDEAAARQAYEAGMDIMLPGIRPPYLRMAHWPPRLDGALTRIDRLQPDAKNRLVQALAATISHDGRMTVAESELLRAVCATLHCPLPPLYAAQ